MQSLIQRLLRRKRSKKAPRPSAATLIITEECLRAVQECLRGETQKDHEGAAFLLGRTDGQTTIAVAAVRPTLRTTPGSFDVSAVAMTSVVRAAADRSLQVVGQVHSHPGSAFHSDGDVEGMRIRFRGYASIVVPHYGRLLPSIADASIVIALDGLNLCSVEQRNVHVVSALVNSSD